MDWLFDLSAAHWAVLGMVLLAAEALGAAGFLIGAGVAALAMAVVTFVFPELGAGTQLASYAGLSLACTYAYFNVFRGATRGTGLLLNHRSRHMIGTTFVLDEALLAGEEGRVQLGDTLWKVVSDTALAAGDKVVVDAAEPMRLIIVPAQE